MPSRADLPTGYSSLWVPGHIMSNHFYDLYCRHPKKGECLLMILVYEMKHITSNGGMFVIMISCSRPGFMGSNVQ